MVDLQSYQRHFPTSNIHRTPSSCYKDFTISGDPSIIVYEMNLFRLKSGNMARSFSMSEKDTERVETSLLRYDETRESRAPKS